MGTNIKQINDGSMVWQSDSEGVALWRIGGPVNPPAGGATVNFRAPYTLKMQLATGSTATGAAGSWLNNSIEDLIVGRVVVRTNTAQTLTSTVTVGIGSTNSVTSTLLIDTQQINVASTVIDNVTNKGTNGATSRVLPAGQFLNVTLNNNTPLTIVATLYVDVEKA